ncbi:MAG: glyoxalase [Betaproteobacteria bacterium]|nr:glyoxalase [Betaproteobacteria bacterium]
MSTPPGLAFSHLGIFARDMQRMEDFYVKVLGLFVTDRGHLETPHGPVELVFLSRNPDEHHQIVLASGRPEKGDFNIVNQISLRADSLATLQAFHRTLLARGTPDLYPVTHGNALSIYFPDPDGNRIELFVDTPWYVTQPLRVPIDLGLPEAEVMANAEAHARTLPGFRSREAWRTDMARMMGML